MDWSIFLDPKFAVLWSGIIGAGVASLISFFSVRASNKSSLDRLNAQLEADATKSADQRKHDAEQKNEDRKAAFRREVYTEAVDEVVKLLGYIGGLPSRDFVNQGQSALEPFLQASNKLWLVADSKAAFLARELTSLFFELYFSAIPHAFKIFELKKSIKWKHGDESMSDEDSAAIKELTKLELTYAKFVMKEAFPINAALVKTVSALREELYLPPDEELFMTQLGDQQRRAITALERLLSEMDVA